MGWKPTSTPRSTSSRSSPTRTAPSAGCSWRTPTPPAMCSMVDPDVARKMLEGRPDVVCAGQFVSRGKAQRADGGFQVQGRFQFGSGISRATWVGGGALVRDADGNPEVNDAGMPKVLAFLVPSDQRRDHGQLGRDGPSGHRQLRLLDQRAGRRGGPHLLALRRRAALWRRRVPPRRRRLRRHRPLGLGARGGPPGARRDRRHPHLRPRPHRRRADARRPGHPAGVQPEHARSALGPAARARHDREHRGAPRCAAIP